MPEQGKPVLTADMKLDQTYELGRTQYGEREVFVIKEGTITGERVQGSVMFGGLDFQLSFSNGAMEIEQIFILQTDDGKYIYLRIAGAAADHGDVRIVPEFEAASASSYDWLNTGKYAGRREVDLKAGTMKISIFDVSGVAVKPDASNSVRVIKPSGYKNQSWDYRRASMDEKQGDMLIKENVTLGSGFINRVLPPAAHHIVGMNDDFMVVYLSEWCEAVKRFGSKACVELVPIASYFGTHEVESSVGIPMEIDCNLLTEKELKDFIEDYAKAAGTVLKAGGDMALVHGAHCQLPALLFSKLFNKRTDKYGPQSFENRCRFAVDILEAIRAEVGDRLAIEYRISAVDMVPGSPDIEEVIEFAKVIQDKIDILHVSRGNLAINKLTPYILPPAYMDHNINVEYASQFKRVLDIPVSVVGAVTLEEADRAVAEGKIDLVALGRQLLADPETAIKLERGQREMIRPCIRCNTCISRSHFGMKPPRCAVGP